MIQMILNELNENNSTNHKLEVLKKHKDNELIQRVLKMTYDRVAFTFGVTMKNVPVYIANGMYTIEHGIDLLTPLYTREITGNAAIEHVHQILSDMTPENALIIEKIIGRDLKINLGRTQINKVWKNLIIKPVYCRCDTYNDKTKKNIVFPAILQLKADGTYREFAVHNGHVESRSRSGESYDYPIIFDQMKDYPDGIYTGELTIKGHKDRAHGNGLINSDNPPHNDIVVELWDFISHDEYKIAGQKDRKNTCTVIYIKRWVKLNEIVTDETKNIRLIPTEYPETIQESLEFTSKWMSEGFEGAILKDKYMVFKDGTSKQQLKLKLEIDAEVRVTGFTEGKKGTKREQTFGAMVFENDEGTIKGQTSGFSDKQLEEFNSKREELIGKVITVQFNDITKGRNNDYYAFSHPRFIEFRDDKDETDSLEKVINLREMAISLEKS